MRLRGWGPSGGSPGPARGGGRAFWGRVRPDAGIGKWVSRRACAVTSGGVTSVAEVNEMIVGSDREWLHLSAVQRRCCDVQNGRLPPRYCQQWRLKQRPMSSARFKANKIRPTVRCTCSTSNVDLLSDPLSAASRTAHSRTKARARIRTMGKEDPAYHGTFQGAGTCPECCTRADTLRAGESNNCGSYLMSVLQAATEDIFTRQYTRGAGVS